MNYTSNYQLNQWEASDAIKRTDFNADNTKIDEALGQVEQRAADALAAYRATMDATMAELNVDKLYFGSYTGNGTAGHTVTLPFAPRLAIFFGHYINGSSSSARLHIATQEVFYTVSASGLTTSTTYTSLSGATLTLNDAYFSNANGQTVHYVLFR